MFRVSLLQDGVFSERCQNKAESFLSAVKTGLGFDSVLFLHGRVLSEFYYPYLTRLSPISGPSEQGCVLSQCRYDRAESLIPG
jgi:hypothetical protein